jgi:hypothetical protein
VVVRYRRIAGQLTALSWGSVGMLSTPTPDVSTGPLLDAGSGRDREKPGEVMRVATRYV